jgi:hypothetical protein
MRLDNATLEALPLPTVADMLYVDRLPEEKVRVIASVLLLRFDEAGVMIRSHGNGRCEDCFDRGVDKGEATQAEEVQKLTTLVEDLQKQLTDLAQGIITVVAKARATVEANRGNG